SARRRIIERMFETARADEIRRLQDRIRGMQRTRLADRTLPTSHALAELLREPSRAGAWCAVVGMPDLGIEAAAAAGIVSGYTCGGPGEPCPGAYFRPNNDVTRGQLSKIVVNTAGWATINPPVAHFRDVPVGSVFYPFVETAVCRGLVSGYDCGPGCYEFRPANNATRGQIAKIAYNAITGAQACAPPAAVTR
ncbi:MAG TPA: S-layer homology domain-containing protein, partial [Thermomicrobiales bacterium]|nr:S-layer homology domain-containing protein [Thermomicrobiales bacterium]